MKQLLFDYINHVLPVGSVKEVLYYNKGENGLLLFSYTTWEKENTDFFGSVSELDLLAFVYSRLTHLMLP